MTTMWTWNKGWSTRQTMYVECNTEVDSCNHWCSGKTVSITYSECGFVALSIKHAMCMPNSHLWPVWLYYIFHIISWRHDLKKKVLEVCFDFVYNFHLKHCSQQCTLVFMYSTCYCCQILMELELSWQSFEKYPNSKFNENQSSGNWVIPYKKTGMSKLIAAFCNFANAPNKSVNTLRTSDANLCLLRFCITTVKDIWHKFSF
jgi:hypothetical protein